MLSRSTVYAIRAAANVEGPHGAFTAIQEIARRTHIPAAYLSKILGELCHKGLLDARRGLHGGVRLKSAPGEVSALEVCRAMADPILTRTCLLNVDCEVKCEECPGYHEWMKEREHFTKLLADLRLSMIPAVCSCKAVQ